MTVARSAGAGALILNVPTIAAATALPASAVILAAVVLAMLGATLGAVTEWGTAGGGAVEPARTAERPAADSQRIAA